MWLKRKKKDSNPYADHTARLIASAIVFLQVRLARILRHWERKASLRLKKTVLILFCMFAGTYCFYLLGDALLRKPSIKDYQPLIPVKKEQVLRPGLRPPVPGRLTRSDTARAGLAPASLPP